MLPPVDAIETVGHGPDLVLVHGTGVSGDSWGLLARLLQDRSRVTMYHRRGTPRWPVEQNSISIADHANDLADLIQHLGDEPAYLLGASFGAAIVLELCRARPDLMFGAALFEPSISTDEGAPAVTRVLLSNFDRLLNAGKPEEAAEYFHRRVLGEPAWQRLSADAKERARGTWPHIHADLRANAAHCVRYEVLRKIDRPVLLLSGGLSSETFGAASHRLAVALPRARQHTLGQADHQLGIGSRKELATVLAEFMGV